MGFPVVPLVQAGLAAWTAYQCYTTGKNIVNDPKVQKSWEERQYIDTFRHTVPHLPVFGDAMRGGRALAQGNSKAACLWPANAIFTLYGGKVIGKGFRSIFNRVIPEINKLRFGRWINKQGGKVDKIKIANLASDCDLQKKVYSLLGKNAKIIKIAKTGNKGNRIVIQKGNKTFDITENRVKEFIANPKNPHSQYGDQVNFKKYGIPEGSRRIVGTKSGKGHKRTPTKEELDLLNYDNN